MNENLPLIPISPPQMTAAGDARGGGTGREFLRNLLGTGTESWNKWLHPGATRSWVQYVLDAPHCITSFGLCSANDYPNRDPASFDLLGRSVETNEWIVLHRVSTCPFISRWQWIWFDIAAPNSSKYVNAVQLRIHSVRHSGDGLQLGHFHLRGSCENVSFFDHIPVAVPTLQVFVEDQQAVCQPPPNEIPGEYIPTIQTICIHDNIMKMSKLQNQIKYLLELPKSSETTVERVMADLIQKAFNLSSPEAAQTFIGHAQLFDTHFSTSRTCFFRELCGFVFALRWESSALIAALKLIITHESADGLIILCGLLTRANRECNSRKRFVFNSIITSSMNYSTPTHESSLSDSSSPYDCARHRLLEASREYLEDVKLRALQSTFVEPIRLYCQLTSNSSILNDLDVHAVSTFIALLDVTLGIKLNRMPCWDDPPTLGAIDILDSHLQPFLELIWRPDNLGKPFEAINGMSERLAIARTSVRRVDEHQFIWHSRNIRGMTTAEFAKFAIDLSQGNSSKRSLLNQYLQQYSSYFQEDLILPKLFIALTTGLTSLSEETALTNMKTILCHEDDSLGTDFDVRHALWDLGDDTLSDVKFNLNIARKLFGRVGVLKTI